MRKISILCAAALIGASMPAQARETAVDDGNDLLQTCDTDTSTSRGYCLGYIRGLSSGVDAVLATSKQYICYPHGVTIGQVRDVVVAFVRNNPGKRHENALVLVSWASAQAWPCK